MAKKAASLKKQLADAIKLILVLQFRMVLPLGFHD